EDVGVSLAPPTSVAYMQVAVSPEGVVHLVIVDSTNGLTHAWRESSWKQESVPPPSTPTGLVQIAASAGDRLTLAFLGRPLQLELIEKVGGVWSTPVVRPTSANWGDPSMFRLETSVTGANPTLAMTTDSGLQNARPVDDWALHTLTGNAPLLGV